MGGYFSSNKVRGQALIIYNSVSRSDAQKLKKLLEDLNFSVHEEENVTAAQIVNAVSKFYRALETEHKDSEMCIVAVLSSYDDKRLNDMEIIELFTNDNAPKLAGKPKLFFFTHTRGSFGERCDPYQQKDDGGKWDKMLILSPTYRGAFDASFYIRTFCETFRKFHTGMNISELLSKTSELLKTRGHGLASSPIGSFPMDYSFK